MHWPPLRRALRYCLPILLLQDYSILPEREPCGSTLDWLLGRASNPQTLSGGALTVRSVYQFRHLE